MFGALIFILLTFVIWRVLNHYSNKPGNIAERLEASKRLIEQAEQQEAVENMKKNIYRPKRNFDKSELN